MKKAIVAAFLQYFMCTNKLGVQDSTFLAISVCWEQTWLLMSSYSARLRNKETDKAFKLIPNTYFLIETQFLP